MREDLCHRASTRSAPRGYWVLVIQSAQVPTVARTESATPEKMDSSIGKLLTRLKTTMASDQPLAEPTDRRKHRPPSLCDVEPMSGMRNENPRMREEDAVKFRDLQTGQEVQQVYDDLEMKAEDRNEAWPISSTTQERRETLGQLDTSNAHHAITPKTPKRVGFAVHEVMEHDAFRPETGYSQQSQAQDRPDTTASSAVDPSSRPTTSFDDSSRPGTELTETSADGNDGAEDESASTVSTGNHFSRRCVIIRLLKWKTIWPLAFYLTLATSMATQPSWWLVRMDTNVWLNWPSNMAQTPTVQITRGIQRCTTLCRTATRPCQSISFRTALTIRS